MLLQTMGLIEIISWPFAKLLWLFNLTGSYVVALLFFAIVVKIVTLPFSIKQQKTQIRAAKLRPKMAAIEKKYAGRTDRKTLEKKQRELMELQQSEGYSPMSGCLPMLIQFPIIIILYNIIQNPLTHILGWSNEFVLHNVHPYLSNPANATTQLQTLTDALASGPAKGMAQDVYSELSSLNLSFFGIGDLTSSPGVEWGWYVIIPILVALSSFVSMKVSRKLMAQNVVRSGTPETRTSGIIMDLIMPLISLYFSFNLPSLLGIYWIYQSLIGMGQQYILSRVMPLPKYTEEEIRAILKAEKEKENANRAAMRRGEYSEKSLHHIDDDDEDEDIYIPEIRSKFDEDEDAPSPASDEAQPAPKEPTPPTEKQHKRQIRKKK